MPRRGCPKCGAEFPETASHECAAPSPEQPVVQGETLSEEERAALWREIGPPTDRDRRWQPMVSAYEVRALLTERDDLARRVREAHAEGWDEGYDRGCRDEIGDLEPADNPYRASQEGK